MPLLLFIEPQPLGFAGEEVVLCICALPPLPLVFSPGKAAVSPVITGCVFEVSGLLCVYTQLLSLSKATRSPACLPAQSESVLQRGCTGSCHCSLGHCPGSVCLSVYLSALVHQLVCPSFCVTLLLRRCRPHGVCRAARLQNETGLGLMAETSSHTLHY